MTLKMMWILILLSQFCICGKTLSKDAEPLQNLSNLNPEGSVMLIRKSRAVLYREGRHSTGEESGRWGLPLASHTSMPAAPPIEPHLDHHDPNVINYLQQDNPKNTYIKQDYHKLDYQSPEYQRTSDSQQMVPVLVQLLKNQLENLETLQQQHRLNENQDFLNENNMKPEVDSFSETSENSFNSGLFDYSSTQKSNSMYKDQEDMYKDIKDPFKKFDIPKDEEYIMRRTNEESNKDSYQKEDDKPDYQKTDSETRNYQNESYQIFDDDKNSFEVNHDIRNEGYRKKDETQKVDDQNTDFDPFQEESLNISPMEEQNLRILQQLGDWKETISLRDNVRRRRPKGRTGVQNGTKITINYKATPPQRCTRATSFSLKVNTMLKIKFIPWPKGCKPKCTVNYMEVFARFGGEENERTGLATKIHDGHWKCHVRCVTLWIRVKDYYCEFNVTVIKDKEIPKTCPNIDSSAMNEFKEQAPTVIAFEVLALAAGVLAGLQVYRIMRQKRRIDMLVDRKLRHSCCNSEMLKACESQTIC